MSDLEDRLREDLQREADEFDPSPDLADRVAARIERRTQRNRLLAAAAAVLIVTAAAGGVLTLRREPDESGIRMHGEGRDSTTTTEPEPEETTTTTAATSTSTATTAPQQRIPDVPLTPSTTTTTAATPPLDPDTPLSRWGAGPIRAGMTIPEAEEAANVTLTTSAEGWVAYGRTCGSFVIEGDTLDGAGPTFWAWTPGNVPSDDPRDAVIRFVEASSTVEGVSSGDTSDDVRATYGEPTSTVQLEAIEYLRYEQDGYGYEFRMIDGQVTGIRSGHVTAPDECV